MSKQVDTQTGEVTDLDTVAAADLAELSAWGRVARSNTAAEKYEAGRHAIEAVERSRFGLPIPRLAYDLPWSNDNGGTVNAILVNLIAADDIEEATSQKELRKAEEIAGLPVTVFQVVARESDVEPEPGNADPDAWGFYLGVELSVQGGPREAISVSGKQAVVTLWRCYCEERLPVQGTFRLLGKKRSGRSQPIGFDVEGKLG